MSYYITTENGEGITAYAYAFKRLKEQGYNWFLLLNAEDCDCSVSGCGTIFLLLVKNLFPLNEKWNHTFFATDAWFQCS